MTDSTPCPARPVLASCLLSQERETLERQMPRRWQTGLPSLDQELPATLWTGGKVMGIIDDGACPDDDSDGDGEHIPSEHGPATPLVTRLIISHLAGLHERGCSSNSDKQDAAFLSSSPPPSPPPAPAIHIVCPPVDTAPAATSPAAPALSPTSLAHALSASSLPAALLASVSLLQYFDFAGLADAIAEVSHTLHVQHHQHQPDQHNPSSITSSTSEQSILILSGLPSTLISLYRRSGTTRTSALLVPLLRSLSQLSRTWASEVLVLVLLDRDSLPPLATTDLTAFGGPSAFPSASLTSDTKNATQDPNSDNDDSANDPLRRARAPARKEATRRTALRPRSATTSIAGAVTDLVLAGLDTLILVHRRHPSSRRRPSTVVEVLSDRVAGLGACWALA